MADTQTSEIRAENPGFDRRARTVRGTTRHAASEGDVLMVAIDGGRYFASHYSCGERVSEGDLVEMENGLWWRARRG